jgi:hypothetical protein
VETVGIRRDRLRRRQANLQWLVAALGAGITAFAAIKLSEARSAEPPLLYIGPTFLTLAIVAAVAAAYCLIKVTWQFDVLNRYIASSKGGQYHGKSAPVDPDDEVGAVWPTLVHLEPKTLTGIDHRWPHFVEVAGYFIATVFAFFAAAALVLFLWAPFIWGWLWPPTPQPKKMPREVLLHTTVFFESGRSALSPAAERSLRNAVKGLMPLDDRCVLIEGHTDAKAGAEYNLALGRMRADRVQSILESEGVPRASVVVSSFGESRPTAAGRSEADFAQNRRVEISLTGCPKSEQVHDPLRGNANAVAPH